MMVKIANPIYDSVFKYLLEDNEVAKILVANILDLKIEKLELQPTELNIPIEKRDFTVFRIDFKATITLNNEERKVVLIEIQKAKLGSDIMRFRKYLGAQYANPNNTYPNQPNSAMPIYTIYFLGTTLANYKHSPIINVNRQYIDNYNKDILLEKEEFIECLTHDAVVIQIPLFKKFRRNRLEKLLGIFEASTRHEVEADDFEDEEYQKVTRRLAMANSSEKIRQEMDLEDEILRELENLERKMALMEEIKDLAIAALEEERRKVEEAEAVLEAERRKVGEAEAVLEAERRKVEEERKKNDSKTAVLKNMAKKFHKKGMSVEEIAIEMDISVGQVKELLG